jgi:hypothetical protein
VPFVLLPTGMYVLLTHAMLQLPPCVTTDPQRPAMVLSAAASVGGVRHGLGTQHTASAHAHRRLVRANGTPAL